MKRIFACLLGLLVGCAVLGLSTALAQEDPKAKDDPAKTAAPSPDEPAKPAAEAKPTEAKPAVSADPEATPAKKADDHAHAHDDKDVGGHAHAHAEEGVAHHDPNDNTHKNASANLHKAEEFRFDQAIATFAIFVLLAIILAKFAWGPITDGLDKREAGIAKMIDDAKLAQQQAEAQLRSYEARLAAAAEESRTMVAQARQDAEATRERERAETKALLEKDRQQAKAEIEAAKNVALQQIAERSVNTAISLASSIVRREIKPEDHDALVTDALGKFSKLN